jgi:hypothetical protein
MKRVRIPCVRATPLLLVALALALTCPTSVAADSPFADLDHLPPMGGGAPRALASAQSPPVAPALTVPESPIMALPAVQENDNGGDLSDPLSYLDMRFGPGKWLFESVLGSIAGLLNTVAAVFKTFGLWAVGGPANGAAGYLTDANLIFTTPATYTVNRAGVQNALGIVQLAAQSIMIVVGTYRAIRLIGAHDRAAILDLVFTLFAAIVLTRGASAVCRLLIDAANIISANVLAQFAFADNLDFLGATAATDPNPLVSLTLALVTLAYWALLAYLALLAVGRIVLVNLFVIVSPLVGLSALSSWGYARTWLLRMIELLATPIIWGVVIGFMRALMTDFGIGANNPVLALFMGAYVLFLAPKAPALLGLAAQHALRTTNVAAVVALARSAVR